MKVERLERICVAVPNLEEGVASFNRVLGLDFEFVGETELPGGARIKIALSSQGVELLEVPGKDIHIRSFHFKVNDMGEAREWMAEKDIKVLSEFSVGKMDEMVLDLFGLRSILVNYPGNDPIKAVKEEKQ